MSGALVGSGSPPPIRVGARNHCMHSIYRAGVPKFASMLRQPIHFAPGAIPIWLPMSVITDHGAGGVRPVSMVVARERRIVSANGLPTLS